MTDFNTYLSRYLAIAEKEIKQLFPENLQPAGLYQPVSYTLNAGGKRFRAALVLSACELFDKDFEKAIHAAVACEIFHNFTLIHDDVMDNAPLRRGKPTVFKKWNISTAILSGDVMLAKAYLLLGKLPETIQPTVFAEFSKMAVELCEGQQVDVDFEKRDDVKIEEYIEMIRLKTAVLIAASLKIGAIVGGANTELCQKIYNFGTQLGIAFQIKDDWLDVFGESAKVGKQVAGDVYSAKKAAVYLKALEFGNASQVAIINQLYAKETRTTEEVDLLIQLFKDIGADKEVLNISNQYFNNSINILDEIQGNGEVKFFLKNMANFLVNRDF